MKTSTGKDYYRCEFCNKLYLVKSACEKHELLCSSNPNNFDVCINCNHCKIIKKHVYTDGHEDGDYCEKQINTHHFHCGEFDKDMYPHIAFKRKLPDKYPEDFEGQVKMPNKCDKYSGGQYESIFERD